MRIPYGLYLPCIGALMTVFVASPALSDPAKVDRPPANFDQPQLLMDAGMGPASVALVDLDGDGKLDLVLGQFSRNQVSVFHGRGDGSFEPGRNFPAGYLSRAVVVADFDHDGHPDLAVADQGSASVAEIGRGSWRGRG